MIRLRLAVALLALPFLGACELYLASRPEITGGVLCNMLGHQVVNDSNLTAAKSEGVPLGTFLGRRIGREVVLIDELQTAEALESSCDGHATTWRNAETGQRYSVTPTRTYQGQSGRCRDFTAVTEVGGREQVIHGTACRRPDGIWKGA
jgi:surface antigen